MAGGLYDLFSRQMNEMDERPYSSTDMSYDERDLVDGDRNRLDRSLNKGRYDDDYGRSRSGGPFAETVVSGERGDRVSGSHYRDVGDHTVTRVDRATHGNDASMDDRFGGFLRDDISGYPASRSDARYDGFSEAQRGGPLQNDVSRVPFDGVSRNAAIPMVPQGWPPLPPVTVYFAEVTVPDEILIQGNVTATLIGPKGSNVKEWQKETGARISIQGTNPFHLEDGSRTNSGGRLRVVINAATLSSKNTAVQKVSEYIEWYRDFPDAVREYLAEKRNEVFLGERPPQPSAPTTTSDSSAAAAVTSSTPARNSSGGAKCADCGSEKHKSWKNSEGANQNVKKLKTEIDEVINAIKLLSSHLPEFSAVSDVLSTNVSSTDVGHLRRRFRDLLPTIETVSEAGKSLVETGESLEGQVCKNWVRQPSPEVEMTDGERRESARAKLNDDNLRELAKVVDLLSMLSQGKNAAAPEPPPKEEKEKREAPPAVVAAAVNVPPPPSPRRPPPPPPPPRPPQPQRESSPDIPPAPLLSSTSSSAAAPVQQKGAPPAPALDEVNLSLLSKVMDALSSKTVAESLGAILEAQKGRKGATKSRARSRSPPPARADARSNSRRDVEEEEDEEAQADNDYGYDNDEMDDHFFSKNVSHRRWIPQQQQPPPPPPPPSRSFRSRSRSRSRSLSSRHRIVTAAVLRRRRSPASPSPSSKRLRRHRSRSRTPSRSRSGSRRRGGRRPSRSRSRSRSRSASPSRRRTGRRYESPPRQVNRTSNNVGGSQGALGNVDPASYVIPLPPSRWDDDDEDDYPPPQAPLRLQYI